jgi:ubiquinone biosynthesis monooxygenase Coq7
MQAKSLSPIDRLISEADQALRVIASKPGARKPSPGRADDAALSDADRAESARLMRVNHSGEVAAQALYRGQAFFARDPQQREQLLAAAAEENDHLAWCSQRTAELGGETSRLAPLWYAGSFAIGAAAGLAGDRLSLGFLAETERQVAEHLDEHLNRLPAEDHASQAILERMRSDEIRHGTAAEARGAQALPDPVKRVMGLTSAVMKALSYRL